MTRLARAGKCEGLGTSGSSIPPRAASAASNSERMPGSKSDPPTSERIAWRRVQPQLEFAEDIEFHGARRSVPPLNVSRSAALRQGGSWLKSNRKNRAQGQPAIAGDPRPLTI